jgi:hypothetical protein
MSRSYEAPTTRSGDRHIDSIETHPAYGTVSASRVSGKAVLFGSDFVHQHYVVIRVHHAELNRSLSNDWPYPRREIVELALSEAQWATFVSTLNAGVGAQCTLQAVGGKDVPQIPEPPDRRQQFGREVDAHLRDGLLRLEVLRNLIEGSRLSGKAREELLDALSGAVMQLTSNLGFVGTQFSEHVERTTERAKVEVAAYVQAVIQRAGVAALAGDGPFAALEPGERRGGGESHEQE